MNKKPFTVLMSVYIKEKPNYLDDSLYSIYDAQSTKPDEIIIVEDGPLSPELYKILNKWEEKLTTILKRIPLETNVGLAKALNKGLLYCKNEYIARMDSDDISLPNRFELQYHFMTSNPEVCVISGQIEEWDEDFKNLISKRTLPITHKEIIKFFKTRSPISHPAAFFKKSAVIASGGYPEIYPEDYALWGKLISKGYIFCNINETILKMRLGNAIQTRRGWKFFIGEFKVYTQFYNLGIINLFEFSIAIAIRFIVRASPAPLKVLLYKKTRK